MQLNYTNTFYLTPLLYFKYKIALPLKQYSTISNNLNISNTPILISKTPAEPFIVSTIITSSRKIEGSVLKIHFNTNFSPWFLTGFTDVEGNFDFVFIKNAKALEKQVINLYLD